MDHSIWDVPIHIIPEKGGLDVIHISIELTCPACNWPVMTSIRNIAVGGNHRFQVSHMTFDSYCMSHSVILYDTYSIRYVYRHKDSSVRSNCFTFNRLSHMLWWSDESTFWWEYLIVSSMTNMSTEIGFKLNLILQEI